MPQVQQSRLLLPVTTKHGFVSRLYSVHGLGTVVRDFSDLEW